MFEDILPIYYRYEPFFTRQNCSCNSESVPLNWTKKTHGVSKCSCRARVHFRFFPIVWKRIRVCCHNDVYAYRDKYTNQDVYYNVAYGWYVPQIYHWRFDRKLVLRIAKYIGYHNCDEYCKIPCLFSGAYNSRPVMDERQDGDQHVYIQRSRPKELTGRYGTVPQDNDYILVSEFSSWEESEIDISSDICPCRQRKQVRIRNIPRIGSNRSMQRNMPTRQAIRWALRNHLFGIHHVHYWWHWTTGRKRVQDKLKWVVPAVPILLYVVDKIFD